LTPGTPNADRFACIECIEQALAVRLVDKVVGRRVSEVPGVIANFGGGFHKGVLAGQFTCREISVQTRLITGSNTVPIGLCFIRTCAAASRRELQ
jgi:hypothetical protein